MSWAHISCLCELQSNKIVFIIGGGRSLVTNLRFCQYGSLCATFGFELQKRMIFQYPASPLFKTDLHCLLLSLVIHLFCKVFISLCRHQQSPEVFAYMMLIKWLHDYEKLWLQKCRARSGVANVELAVVTVGSGEMWRMSLQLLIICGAGIQTFFGCGPANKLLQHSRTSSPPANSNLSISDLSICFCNLLCTFSFSFLSALFLKVEGKSSTPVSFQCVAVWNSGSEKTGCLKWSVHFDFSRSQLIC